MSALILVALTSFAGLEGKIREGETFEASESRAKELVRLKLAKEATEDTAKAGPVAGKTKEDKPAAARKTKPAADAEKTKDAADMTTENTGLKPDSEIDTKTAE